VYYTYILKMIDQDKFYVGSTDNLEKRMEEHKSGQSYYTKNKNWELFSYTVFRHEYLARQFEKYLKSGSGRAFARKHFNCNSIEF
jgi:predicted GIY-YIG superfamily endonuclease